MRMNEIWWRILMMSRWIPADCPAASHCSGHYQRQMQKQLRKRRSGRNRRSHALRCLSWQRLLQRKDNKVMLPFVVSQWTNRFFFCTGWQRWPTSCPVVARVSLDSGRHRQLGNRMRASEISWRVRQSHVVHELDREEHRVRNFIRSPHHITWACSQIIKVAFKTKQTKKPSETHRGGNTHTTLSSLYYTSNCWIICYVILLFFWVYPLKHPI
jgi:hypothetical protein